MIKNALKLLFLNPIGIWDKIICKVRSLYFSKFIDDGMGKITVGSKNLDIEIRKGPGSKLVINGDFRISPHIGGTAPVRIYLGKNASLKIDGDFIIGHGVRISLSENAQLYIGGKDNESDSGITSDTLIMVNKKIHIGVDFICAWNVFITDSDWHQINDQDHQADVKLGDKVWIANNSQISKGSIVGNNCIVASHTKISNATFPPGSLIAGIPGKIRRTGINWKRDI